MSKIANNRLRVRLESVIGELHQALVVNQRHSIDHRVKSAPPSFSHAPNPISEVVDGNQISLLDVTTCPRNTKLDLGQFTIRETPMGLEGGFSGFVNSTQGGLEFLCRWPFQKTGQGGRGQPRGRSAEVGFGRRVGVAQAEIAIKAKEGCGRRSE